MQRLLFFDLLLVSLASCHALMSNWRNWLSSPRSSILLRKLSGAPFFPEYRDATYDQPIFHASFDAKFEQWRHSIQFHHVQDAEKGATIAIAAPADSPELITFYGALQFDELVPDSHETNSPDGPSTNSNPTPRSEHHFLPFSYVPVQVSGLRGQNAFIFVYNIPSREWRVRNFIVSFHTESERAPLYAAILAQK